MAIFRPKPFQIFFFGLVSKSPIHIGLIYVKNPKPNISCLGPFKGSYMIEKIKEFWPILKFFFVPRSLKTTRNYCSFPHNGSINKKISPKSYCLCITSNEIVQNSKSKPKQFSFLCTFKLALTL
jgi:hypothetical protein